jgi:hypothetical protein
MTTRTTLEMIQVRILERIFLCLLALAWLGMSILYWSWWYYLTHGL